MRVSILVNSVDPTACHDYAVLWLDPTHHVWTRQTSVGIALPPEGTLVEREGSTLLTGPDTHDPGLLTLGDFRVDARERLTSIFGTAAWFSQTRHATIDGLWHLRAVERAPDGPHARRAGRAGGAQPPTRCDNRARPAEFR